MIKDYQEVPKMTKCKYCAGNKCFFVSQIFCQLTTTQLQVVAEVIGVCSCGDNQLIDHINEVCGNEVKIMQAVDSSVGMWIILLKKQLRHA